MSKTVELIARTSQLEQSAAIECDEADLRESVWTTGNRRKMSRPAEISLRGLQAVRDRFKTRWTHLAFWSASGQRFEGSIYGRPVLLADGVRIALYPVGPI